jgi:formamidopyrimidine-DNA glycosylase
MPELPDLQAFRRNLSKRLVGLSVSRIHARYKKKLKSSEKDLQRAIQGAKLTSINREGKELHFLFDNGNVLGIHLMLKGRLYYFQDKNEHKYTIIEMLFNDGTGLAVTDYQKQATPTLNPETSQVPDALSSAAGYRFLKTALNRSKTSIKKLLTDQKVIRGIGNAYADEILWHARISPFSVSSRIPDTAIKKLSRSIRTVLANAEKSILKKEPDIIGGEVRDFLKIHNASKSHSPTGGKIIKDDRSGRSTYYTEEQELWN